ncbi:hypothetical protein [Phocaeicola sp.]
MDRTVLNPVQIRLLETFAGARSQEEADELTDLICEYYFRKLDDELERLWNERTLDQKKLDELRDQHLRTPYK